MQQACLSEHSDKLGVELQPLDHVTDYDSCGRLPPELIHVSRQPAKMLQGQTAAARNSQIPSWNIGPMLHGYALELNHTPRQ